MERRFPRDVRQLAAIFEFAASFCANRGVGEADRRIIDLVLEELFSNVLRHGRDGGGEVLIELEHDDGAVRIALTDFDAERFDPADAQAPDVDAPLAERAPGGLGIHLIRQMADGIDYEYRDNVSRTIVTKKLR